MQVLIGLMLIKMATRILNAAGIAAPLLWAGAVVYCGASRPGYDPVNQFISELAERGSSTESLMRIMAFYLPGMLSVMFGVLIITRFAGWPVGVLLIINGAARVTAGIFPCDPGCPVTSSSVSQVVHNAAAMVNGVTLPSAALFCSFRLWKTGHNRFAFYSLLSATIGMLFLLLMLMNATTRNHAGLFQRLSFGTVNLWLAAFAVTIWRSKTETIPSKQQE